MKRLILCITAFATIGFSQAKSDVVPQPTVLVSEKILIEPLCAVSKNDPRCTKQAKPRGDTSNWLSTNDYSFRSKNQNQSGAVILQLEVDPVRGWVQSCKVVKSSGFELLDKSSCFNLQRRARFVQQAEAPSALYFDLRVVWLAPWLDGPTN